MAVLRGIAGWGAWLGLQGTGTAWRERLWPLQWVFKGADDSVGLDLEIALEIAAELLTLISKTSQRYLFSIPTCLMSLLITETDREMQEV